MEYQASGADIEKERDRGHTWDMNNHEDPSDLDNFFSDYRNDMREKAYEAIERMFPPSSVSVTMIKEFQSRKYEDHWEKRFAYREFLPDFLKAVAYEHGVTFVPREASVKDMATNTWQIAVRESRNIYTLKDVEDLNKLLSIYSDIIPLATASVIYKDDNSNIHHLANLTLGGMFVDAVDQWGVKTDIECPLLNSNQMQNLSCEIYVCGRKEHATNYPLMPLETPLIESFRKHYIKDVDSFINIMNVISGKGDMSEKLNALEENSIPLNANRERADIKSLQAVASCLAEIETILKGADIHIDAIEVSSEYGSKRVSLQTTPNLPTDFYFSYKSYSDYNLGETETNSLFIIADTNEPIVDFETFVKTGKPIATDLADIYLDYSDIFAESKENIYGMMPSVADVIKNYHQDIGCCVDRKEALKNMKAYIDNLDKSFLSKGMKETISHYADNPVSSKQPKAPSKNKNVETKAVQLKHKKDHCER